MARTLVGTRFAPYGASREGCDCIGVFIFVGRELGLLPERLDLPPYSYPPAPGVFDECMPRFLDEVPLEELQEGDILLLFNAQTDVSYHTLMVVEAEPHKGWQWEYVGIAPDNLHRVISRRIEIPEWQDSIRKVYRYRGLDD